MCTSQRDKFYAADLLMGCATFVQLFTYIPILTRTMDRCDTDYRLHMVNAHPHMLRVKRINKKFIDYLAITRNYVSQRIY